MREGIGIRHKAHAGVMLVDFTWGSGLSRIVVALPEKMAFETSRIAKKGAVSPARLGQGIQSD